MHILLNGMDAQIQTFSDLGIIDQATMIVCKHGPEMFTGYTIGRETKCRQITFQVSLYKIIHPVGPIFNMQKGTRESAVHPKIINPELWKNLVYQESV